jgi:hypothetical protein
MYAGPSGWLAGSTAGKGEHVIFTLRVTWHGAVADCDATWPLAWRYERCSAINRKIFALMITAFAIVGRGRCCHLVC